MFLGTLADKIIGEMKEYYGIICDDDLTYADLDCDWYYIHTELLYLNTNK